MPHCKSLNFKHFVLLLTLVATSVSAGQLQAADKAQQEPENALTIVHSIASRFPVQKRIISVQLPLSYHADSHRRYPVIYLLDGESNLKFTTTIGEHLTESSQIPEMIIVGLHAGDNRAADYLPLLEAEQAKATGQSGQAHLFLSFIDKELLSFIDKTYRTTPYRILSGHSYGGVFVSYAMTQKPDLFQAYFAQSPFFNTEMGEPSYARIAKLLAENPNFKNTFFITIGDEPNLISGFTKIEALLKDKAPETLRWSASYQAGRTHMQTRFIGIYEALESLFAIDWPLNNAVKSDNIEAHFEALNRKYGISPQYALQDFAQSVQTLLGNGNANGGRVLAKEFVKQYPESPFSHFFLFNAYAMVGNKIDALKEVNIAIKLIDNSPSPSLEMQQLYPNLKQVQKQLGG